MRRHFKRWNLWRKQNKNGLLYKILVLLRLAISPSFEMYYRERKEE